jgi:hypothetical protein
VLDTSYVVLDLVKNNPGPNDNIAVFKCKKKYTITFKDDDGTILSTAKYKSGTTADKIVKPADPTKAPTAELTYAFAGWTPEVTAVTGDAVYTATYTTTTNQYTVTFKDDDGTVLKEATAYDYGTTADKIVKPADPTKAPTAEYTYAFTGWTPEVTTVTGDAVYTATYSDTKNQYTVTFKDDDGTVLKEATAYDYGTTADKIEKPADPTKKETSEYTYKFAGWTPAITTVTADVTYTATYTATKKEQPAPLPTPTSTTETKPDQYLVTFLDCKGNTVKIEWVNYGENATAPTGFGTYSGYWNVTSHRDLKPDACGVNNSFVVPNTADKN